MDLLLKSNSTHLELYFLELLAGVEYLVSLNKSMLKMDFNFPNANSSNEN